MKHVSSEKPVSKTDTLRLCLSEEVERICELEYSRSEPVCLRRVFAAFLVAIGNLEIEMHQCVEKLVLQVPNNKGWQAPLLRQATQNLRRRDWYARQEPTMSTKNLVTDLMSELADIGVVLKKHSE